MAFGVPIIETVPSRLRRSQLDSTVPRLRVRILLDDNLKTLGDLLGRVAKITGLELVADRRVAELPLLWRIASGQKARAGDILEALCWSVSGAFRRVGDSTFLLTDDIQGIGTRFAKLAEWAETPFFERQKALDTLNQKTAQNNPLTHVGFAPGDNNALPPSLLQSVNNSYLNAAEEPAVTPSSLPASLQLQIQRQVQFWADNATTVRADRVQIHTPMVAQYVFPDGGSVEAPFSESIGPQYLQFASVRVKPTVPNDAPAPFATPKPMPASLHKRVLVAQLPPEEKALDDLLTLARRKGFTEVWLHIMLNDGEGSSGAKSRSEDCQKSWRFPLDVPFHCCIMVV